MKSASAPLIAALTGGQKLLLADLYTFTLANGTVARYALAEGDVTYGGNAYSGTSVVIGGGKIKTVIGVQVDTLDLTIDALPEHLLGGVSWMQAARQGALDGARVKLDRLFMAYWGDTSLGTINVFNGRVAGLEIGRGSLKMRVNSDLELLSASLPRVVFQPGCVNTLFDGGCTLVKSSYGVSGTVSGGSSAATIYNSLTSAGDYFALGTITFTSGALSGVSASVKSYIPGTLTLLAPLLLAPSAGDTFTAYPGCDKAKATCQYKFSNLTHFRGTPFVPQPEAIL